MMILCRVIFWGEWFFVYHHTACRYELVRHSGTEYREQNEGYRGRSAAFRRNHGLAYCYSLLCAGTGHLAAPASKIKPLFIPLVTEGPESRLPGPFPSVPSMGAYLLVKVQCGG